MKTIISVPPSTITILFHLFENQIEILRSIRGFLAAGNGTTELHRGHVGLFIITNTYDKHPGQPAAIGDDKDFKLSSSRNSFSAAADDDDDEYDVDGDDFHNDDRFFMGFLSARSSADLTLSKVQTL